MKLAIKLSDSNLTNSLSFDEKQKTLSYAQKIINATDILDYVEKDTVLRYPKTHYDNLSQRCYTYIPGSEAYPINSSPIDVSDIYFTNC